MSTSTRDESVSDSTVEAPTSGSPGAGQGRLGRRGLGVVEKYGLVGLLVLVIVFFSLFGPTRLSFPSQANIALTLGDQAVTLMVALALLPVLICGYYDLSVGAVTGVSAIATASAMSSAHLAAPWAIVIGILVGALVGGVNALIVVGLGLNSFIATLAMATLLAGLVQLYTNGLPIQSGISQKFSDFGSGSWLGIPAPVFVIAVAAVVTWYLLGYTVVGRHLHSIGSNPAAAHLVGISVERLVVGAFVWAGAVSGIAGVLLASRTSGANPQVGPDFLFPAFAAVFLGASAIRPGQFNVVGTVVGLYFLAFTISGITLAGVDAWVQPFFNGVALLLAVGLSTVIGRRRRTTRS